MGKRFTDLSDDLYDYLFSVGVREPELLGRLRRETDTMPMAGMQVSPDQGQFMAQLVRFVGGSPDPRNRSLYGLQFPVCCTGVAEWRPPSGIRRE